MAEFVAFDPDAQVLGIAYLAIVEAVPAYKRASQNLLINKGVSVVDQDQWHNMQSFLDILKFIKERIGNHTLFAIGKATIENARLPYAIDSFENALYSLDAVYHFNHRGEVGNYRVIGIDYEQKVAMVECHTPYPSEFERGLLTALIRKHKPAGASIIHVEKSKTRPSRDNDSDSDTFIISW